MEPTAITKDGMPCYECHACGTTLEPNGPNGLRDGRTPIRLPLLASRARRS